MNMTPMAARTIRIPVAVVLALLGGCSSTRMVYLDNGGTGYLVHCAGYFNSWENCLIKAGQTCRSRGYETVRTEEYDRSLLFACKAPGAPVSAPTAAAAAN